MGSGKGGLVLALPGPPPVLPGLKEPCPSPGLRSPLRASQGSSGDVRQAKVSAAV